jgi:hypothetical protein
VFLCQPDELILPMSFYLWLHQLLKLGEHTNWEKQIIYLSY